MSDPSPPAPQPVFQQAFQGILAREVTNNYVSLPVHYHQPTGTRYIPMTVLRNMYPGIIGLQVDGQIVEPRRGLPTAQSMFQSAMSQWVDETIVVSDAEEGGSNTSYSDIRGGSASSSVAVVSQNDRSGTLVGGGQESQLSTTATFHRDGINASLLSEPAAQALSDDDANDSTIEYLEYRPDSIIQVVHYTPGPIETPAPTDGSQSGIGRIEGAFPPSFWARIRQEIYTAVRQVHQELAEEQAQVHGGNSTYGNQAAEAEVVTTSSWIATQCSIDQPCSPSKSSIISLSSSSSPESGSRGSGSEPNDMDEDVVVVARPTSSKAKCKDKKRDRDEEDVDDSSSNTSGSEKRLRSNVASPESTSSPTDDSDYDEDNESGSRKSPSSKASSRSGSNSRGSGAGSGSGSGSSSGSSSGSCFPRSGSSSCFGSGSDSGAVSSGSTSEIRLSEPALSCGSGSGTSPGLNSRATFGSGSGLSRMVASHGTEPGSPTGSSLGSPSSSLFESFATAKSQAFTPEARASSVSFEILTPPLLGGKHAPAMARQSEEPNRGDSVMITTSAEGNRLEDEIISIDSGDGGDDIDPDDTQPLRITNNQLRYFVAKRKGLLVRESQAVTICLKTSKDARRFYRLLKSQDYFGTWLNIKLAWTWDREQMRQLVEALVDSPTEVLFFDGCIDRAAAAATTAATALNTSVSILSTPSTSKEGDSQSVDSNTRTRRYDPLIRLFRQHQFKELHFYGLPNLFHHSIAPIPWNLSHLGSFRLHARISDWEGIQANRFLQFIKRATNLEHLYIGCPTERYMKYVDEITRAMDLSERNRDSPPLDIHFQHYQHRHTLLRVKYDQSDREFKEFEVDLMGTSYESHIQWKPILDKLVDGTLVSLSFKNMLDEMWMDTVMEWVYIQADDRGVGLENLQLDCMHFGPTQYHDLIKLLELTQPRLQTLTLRNVNISFPNNISSASETSATPTTTIECDLDLDLDLYIDRSDVVASVPMIGWPTLVKSLNIAVLSFLCIKTSNLQDQDIDGVVSCLRMMVRNSKKLALEKLLLQGAQFSVIGEQTLVKEIQAILPGVDVKFR
ncbi:hypothetical protein BGZ96_001116 [Linnemannia gamsii]|uniref:RNI-like protein n=1 Tax=Linnemannia gamsii TaxID=64522 RepID=A0ABQ7KA82_9FUNG|nr:hypothetical protein BGZ96_001116 [Linnemannia gamsii]